MRKRWPRRTQWPISASCCIPLRSIWAEPAESHAAVIPLFLPGEGETGLMVYTILQRLWEAIHAAGDRPCLFLMSD